MVVSKVVYVSITVIIANGMNHHCLGFSVVTHPNPSYLTHKKKQPIRRWSAFDAKLSSSTLRAVSPSLIVPTSLISASNHWGNIAVLSLSASFAQLLGKTTLIGRLLGAPVTAMALAFVLSSLSILPSFTSGLNWLTLLPPGGSQASSFLQIVSLTLATPLLLLGTSIRGRALRRCGSLLGSFVIASLGTLVGAIIAIVLPSTTHIIPPLTLPNGDGVKIATALLAKNIGGGINYMAVCSCLGAAPESIAAGLCVDNVMALAYFPLTSALASKFKDVDDCDNPRQESNLHHDENNIELISPVESLSHAFTIAVVLTASGQCLNNLLQRNSKSLNLSLPITTLLTVVFSTFYPPNWFMSPATSSNERSKNNLGFSNSIAKSGEVVSLYVCPERKTKQFRFFLRFIITPTSGPSFLSAGNITIVFILRNSRSTRLETQRLYSTIVPIHCIILNHNVWCPSRNVILFSTTYKQILKQKTRL